MHHHEVGEGPVVLFLHGSGPGASGWSNFRDSAGFLAEHGYRCIMVDSLGYGHSSKPTDRPYTLPFMAGGALSLMDALGIDSFTLIGNSQGGAQAIWLALEHPERVEGLILMAPGGLETRETYMEMRGIRSMMRCIYGPEGITLDGMQRVFTKQVVDPSRVPEGVIERRYAVAMTQPQHVFKSMRVDNLTDRLSEITQPTMALWGIQDQFCAVSGADTLEQHLPGAEVIRIDQCGHWVMVEHSDLFNTSCLRFLSRG